MEKQFWISTFLTICVSVCNASWGSPGLGQYHIQTDEGPERYFRFQTDNGQYRKEKRLQDGTVIGTDAWIDAAGYLRQKDYIADSQGYRILKSKTVFVGQGRPIEEAIRSIKHVPAQSGTLAGTSSYSFSHTNKFPSTTTSKPLLIYSTTTTTTSAPSTSEYIPPIESTTASPIHYLGYDHYPTPQVFIRHHSQPVDDNHIPEHNYIPSSTDSPIHVPSQEYEPPYENDYKRVRPIAIINTTPAPITADGRSTEYDRRPTSTALPPITSTSFTPISSTPATIGSSTPYAPSPFSNPAPFSIPSTTPLPIIPTTYRPTGYSYTTPAPPITYDSVYNSPYSTSTPTKRPTAVAVTGTGTPPPIIPLGGNDLEIQPLYTRSRTRPSSSTSTRNRDPLVYNNNLGSGYDRQFDEYDGVGVTRNGFRYYLPRQYHEEENIDSERRAGSFGYVDPFGIRRVIYYNASPEKGFVHRKNNRYVGFNATPYDPRPI